MQVSWAPVSEVLERPERLWFRAPSGTIRPVLDRVFDFDDTIAALDYVGSGRTKGKVVVTMK